MGIARTVLGMSSVLAGFTPHPHQAAQACLMYGTTGMCGWKYVCGRANVCGTRHMSPTHGPWVTRAIEETCVPAHMGPTHGSRGHACGRRDVCGGCGRPDACARGETGPTMFTAAWERTGAGLPLKGQDRRRLTVEWDGTDDGLQLKMTEPNGSGAGGGARRSWRPQNLPQAWRHPGLDVCVCIHYNIMLGFCMQLCDRLLRCHVHRRY